MKNEWSIELYKYAQTLDIKIATTTSTRAGQVMMAYKETCNLQEQAINKLLPEELTEWFIKHSMVDFYLLTLYYINHIITILFYKLFILY